MVNNAALASNSGARRVMRGLNSPLRVRVYVLIGISLAITLTALWIEGASRQEALRDHDRREYQSRVTAAATNLTARLATISASLGLADSLVTHGHTPESLCEVMGREPGRLYQRLYVFTPEGRLTCFTVPGVHDQPEVMLGRAYFAAALATGQGQVGGPLVEASSGRVSIMSAHPIRGGSGTVGVVVAATDATTLFDLTPAVTQSDRTLVFGRDGGWFEIGSQEATSPPFAVSSVLARSVATGEPCPVIEVATAAWTCAPVGRTGLVIVSAHPTGEVFDILASGKVRMRNEIIGLVVIALVAGFASDFLFLRRIRLVYGQAGLGTLGAEDTMKRDEIDAIGEWASATAETNRRLQQEVDTHERRRLNSERDLLTSIAETVEIRYPFLRNHGDRVGRYARQIGIRLGFSEHDLELLEFAARVHDLGKIAIADSVYLKPGRLEPIEAAQMQLHAARGGEIASRMRNVPPEVADAIRHHHERWDGAGYPDGLAGTAIPLWSRVIAVADSYDAMTEERPYRAQPLGHGEALETLRGGVGTQWDTAVVHAFLDVVESGNVLPKPVALASRRAADG